MPDFAMPLAERVYFHREPAQHVLALHERQRLERIRVAAISALGRRGLIR